MDNIPRRLYRSTRDRKIWGVCGGLAEYFSIDPVLVRVIFVVLAFFSGVGLLLYVVLALVTPSASTASGAASASSPVPPAGVRGQQALAGQPGESGSRRGTSAGTIIGVALIVVGAVALIASLARVWWLTWGMLGPLVLIVLGILLFFGKRSG